MEKRDLSNIKEYNKLEKCISVCIDLVFNIFLTSLCNKKYFLDNNILIAN